MFHNKFTKMILPIPFVLMQTISAANVDRIYSLQSDFERYNSYFEHEAGVTQAMIDADGYWLNSGVVSEASHATLRLKLDSIFSTAYAKGFRFIEIPFAMPYSKVSNWQDPTLQNHLQAISEFPEIALQALDAYNKNTVQKLSLRVRFNINAHDMANYINSFPDSFDIWVNQALGSPSNYQRTGGSLGWWFFTHRIDGLDVTTVPDFGKPQVVNWVAGWIGYLSRHISSTYKNANLKTVFMVWDKDGQCGLDDKGYHTPQVDDQTFQLVYFSDYTLSSTPSTYQDEVRFLLARQTTLAKAVKAIKECISKNTGDSVRFAYMYTYNTIHDRSGGILDMVRFIEETGIDELITPDFGDLGLFEARGNIFRSGSISRRFQARARPLTWTIELSWPGLLINKEPTERDIFHRYEYSNDELDLDNYNFLSNYFRSSVEAGATGISYCHWPSSLLLNESKFSNLSKWTNVWGVSADAYLQSLSAQPKSGVAIYMGDSAMDYLQKEFWNTGYSFPQRWYKQGDLAARGLVPNALSPSIDFLTDYDVVNDPLIFTRYTKILLPKDQPLNLANQKLIDAFHKTPQSFILTAPVR